jgi:hypothetical protein
MRSTNAKKPTNAKEITKPTNSNTLNKINDVKSPTNLMHPTSPMSQQAHKPTSPQADTILKKKKKAQRGVLHGAECEACVVAHHLLSDPSRYERRSRRLASLQPVQ